MIYMYISKNLFLLFKNLFKKLIIIFSILPGIFNKTKESFRLYETAKCFYEITVTLSSHCRQCYCVRNCFRKYLLFS